MTAQTAQAIGSRKSFNPLPLLAIVIFLVIAAIAVGQTYSHATLQHGGDAVAVRNCMDRNGPSLYIQQEPNRFIAVCKMDKDGLFGWQVLDKLGKKYEEVTAYPNSSFKSLSAIKDWAAKRGYAIYQNLP